MSKLMILCLSLLLLNGCLGPVPPEKPEATKEVGGAYVSRVDLPESKAYLSFLQFMLLTSDGRNEEAIAFLQQALAYDPGSYEMQLQLARAYFSLQRLEDAGAVLSTLTRDWPEDKSAWGFLGVIRAMQGRNADARDALTRALQIGDGSVELRLRLIDVLARLQEYPDAIRQAKILTQDHPQRVRFRLVLGELLQKGNRAEEAIRYFSQLEEEFPNHEQVLLARVQVLNQNRRDNEAIRLLRQRLEQHPRWFETRLRFVELLQKNSAVEEARAQLETALELQPQQPKVLRRILLLQLDLKQYPAVERKLRQLLSAQEDSTLRYLLGLALEGQQREEEAQQQFALVSPENRRYDDALLRRAYYLFTHKQVDSACNLLYEALNQGRRSLMIYRYLAGFEIERENMVKAQEVLLRGTVDYPRSAELHYTLGTVYERAQDRKRALQQMEIVLQQDPRHADALNFVA